MKSNKEHHFAVILGARPNFVKAAPFFKEARKHPEFSFTIIHTGQHYDENMSKIFFDEMRIPRPHIHLNLKGTLSSEKIGNMFSSLTRALESRHYDGGIVFGDVNSTLAGAISCARKKTDLIHIEAGLRSNDRRMPEEINRVIVDHLSDLHFTTEPAANENLKKEGIAENKTKYVGNIMIESIEIFFDHIQKSPILSSLGLRSKEYAVVTLHREENTNNKGNLEKILTTLNEVNKKIPLMLPIHPGTRNDIEKYGLSPLIQKWRIIAPLGYFEFMKLMLESRGVITDSGGIQEETSHLGIPCCTLRDNTERPITLELGSNKLFSPFLDLNNPEDLIEHINRTDFKARQIPLWDDKVSERIFSHLVKIYL